MKRDKVGLVTLWKRNYGSALQCYATQNEFSKRGYQCELLYQSFEGIERYKHYLKEAYFLAINSICYPGYFKTYNTMRQAGKHSISSLSECSAEKLDGFAEKILQPKGFSYGNLKKIGKSSEYRFFLAGSDQVWSGNRKKDPVMFLEFAPKEKRVAISPSFGTNDVADFNNKAFKSAISNFKFLSVREARGKEIIKELTNLDVPQLCDPTFLLTADEWAKFSKDASYPREKYILVHFLDEPNDVALDAMRKMQEIYGYLIYYFAYPHKEIENLDGAVLLDGGPEEYVSAIRHAEAICTDSFHTSLFSIFFKKDFFIFERQYRHSGSQSSRITSLLELFKYEDRKIEELGHLKQVIDSPMHDCELIVAEERKKLCQYLDEVFKYYKIEN